jgi:hypothetical protein
MIFGGKLLLLFSKLQEKCRRRGIHVRFRTEMPKCLWYALKHISGRTIAFPCVGNTFLGRITVHIARFQVYMCQF